MQTVVIILVFVVVLVVGLFGGYIIGYNDAFKKFRQLVNEMLEGMRTKLKKEQNKNEPAKRD